MHLKGCRQVRAIIKMKHTQCKAVKFLANMAPGILLLAACPVKGSRSCDVRNLSLHSFAIAIQ